MADGAAANRVGVDVGGTFTDIARFDGTSWHLDKTLTTPADLSVGMLTGIENVGGAAGFSGLDCIVHGSTVVPNAILQRKGAKTGLITTAGFRDVLEFGREPRYDLFDLAIEKPIPLIPRSLRCEVRERLLPDGRILEPLNELDVRSAAQYLVDAGCVSIAVVFLHSFLNPAHETRAAEIIAAEFPSIDVSLSASICPELGEYERTSTTSINAYVQPLIRRYVGRLSDSLSERGFQGDLLLMQSNGAAVAPDLAIDHPIQLVESGSAAGALAAAAWGRRAGEPNIVSFDMGGTTAKICVIHDGRPELAFDIEVARLSRFKAGSGLPLRLPVVEMLEIGAGGGSIAALDSMGLIRVGPESAGADPGPACYARNGDRPTVTDADLMLGYLDPGHFLGGRMALRPDLGEQAIRARIAEPLGLDIEAAAVAIADVVNSSMADATRLHVIERGGSPSRFALLAFGGAGPVHAYEVAIRTGIHRVLCPPYAGVASAIGLLTAQPLAEVAASQRMRVDALNTVDLDGLLTKLEAEARRRLRQMSNVEPINLRRVAAMCYVGQRHQLLVALPDLPVRHPDFASTLRSRFETMYEATYGRALPGRPVESLTWRVSATVGRDPDELFLLQGYRTVGSTVKGHRRAYFPEANEFLACTVYDRYSLAPGMCMAGPAIVEERESTLIVGPSGTCRVLDDLTIVMEVEPPA